MTASDAATTVQLSSFTLKTVGVNRSTAAAKIAPRAPIQYGWKSTPMARQDASMAVDGTVLTSLPHRREKSLVSPLGPWTTTALSGALSLFILVLRLGFRRGLRGVRCSLPTQVWAEVTYPLAGTVSLAAGWVLSPVTQSDARSPCGKSQGQLIFPTIYSLLRCKKFILRTNLGG